MTTEVYTSVARGDAANQSFFRMMNHLGTHIDCPHHFLNNLRTVDSYDISAFVFDRPFLLDIEKQENELVTRKDLEAKERRIIDSDIVLIRTGFGRRFRSLDKRRYESSGPGFSVGAAEYLRGFRELRAVGLDFISLSSPNFQEEGRTAHRILLSNQNERAFFIIEDMKLDYDISKINRVFVAPLFIQGFDGSPVTIIAEA